VLSVDLTQPRDPIDSNYLWHLLWDRMELAGPGTLRVSVVAADAHPVVVSALKLMPDLRGRNYVQDCVVYKSYYRCATLHGTNYARLSRNVAFDAHGHCFYLEDGVEEQNTIEFNLVQSAKSVCASSWNAFCCCRPLTFMKSSRGLKEVSVCCNS
jgi:hypothetical protein